MLVSCRLASKRYWWVSNITIFEPLSAGLIIMCGCDLSCCNACLCCVVMLSGVSEVGCK